MPFNLLLIPLLGGYIFVRHWNYTKISILRADKDRILIRASLAGFFFLIPSYFIALVTPHLIPCRQGPGVCLYTWWTEHVTFEYMGVSLIAFTLASTVWWPLNKFLHDEESQIDRMIEEDADPLEQALKDSKDGELALAITLSNEKVYIGIVTHTFNPATPTNNIAILPLQSGYRDKETKRLYLKNNYSVIIQDMRREIDSLAGKIKDQARIHAVACKGEGAERCDHDPAPLYDRWDELEEKINLFEVVVPVDQITSVFFFDDQIYEEYFIKPYAPTPLPPWPWSM